MNVFRPAGDAPPVYRPPIGKAVRQPGGLQEESPVEDQGSSHVRDLGENAGPVPPAANITAWARQTAAVHPVDGREDGTDNARTAQGGTSAPSGLAPRGGAVKGWSRLRETRVHPQPSDLADDDAREVAERMQDVEKETSGKSWIPRSILKLVSNLMHQWVMLGCMLGWDEAARRCVNEATTIGVISALLAGITFTALLTPPQPNNVFSLKTKPLVLLRLYSYGVFLSIYFSMISVIFCTTIITQLNLATTQEDIRRFFIRYEFLPLLNVASFLLSLAFLVVTVVTSMTVNFHFIDAMVCLCFYALAFIILSIVSANVYTTTTFYNIQRHYNQIMEVKAKLANAARGNGLGQPQGASAEVAS